MSWENFSIQDAPLGKDTTYHNQYNPRVLFPIPRMWTRDKTFGGQLPKFTKLPHFYGADVWNNYEFTFIDKNTNSRRCGFLQMVFPATSYNLIESKSLKLYLFSFAEEKLTESECITRIASDLTAQCKEAVLVRLLDHLPTQTADQTAAADGVSLFPLDDFAPCKEYQADSRLLRAREKSWETTDKPTVQRFRMSQFRSNCLVTGKPDWAEVEISLTAKVIVPKDDLYRYLVSFRDHLGIHEQCMEKIVFDVYEVFQPSFLKVVGFFTRRGSCDINPVRIISEGPWDNSNPKMSLEDFATQWRRHRRQ